jgi:hypothetical protein
MDTRNGRATPEGTAHATHDVELIATFAAGDAAPTDIDRALRLVTACGECAALAADVRSIGGALHASGRMTVEAPRDFRITAEQAARLRPTSPAARLRAWLGSWLGNMRQPLGTGLAAIGFVGLVVGTVALGAVTSSPASLSDTGGASAGGIEVASPAAPNASEPPKAFASGEPVMGPLSSDAGASERSAYGGPGGASVPGTRDEAPVGGAAATIWLLVASAAALVAGLILLRWRPGGRLARR